MTSMCQTREEGEGGLQQITKLLGARLPPLYDLQRSTITFQVSTEIHEFTEALG